MMKSCSYWNSNTLASIVDNSKRVCGNLCLNGCISSSNLPKTVDICGAEGNFNVLSDNKEGLLCDSVQSKSILENTIIFIAPAVFGPVAPAGFCKTRGGIIETPA